MKELLLRLIINAAAIYVTVLFVPGIGFGEGGVDVGSLLIVALIFGLVNAVIKPIVAIFTCPFYILTLGLFTFIVNAGMLLLTERIAGRVGAEEFSVASFTAALVGGIVISIVSTLLSIFVSDDDD
ncbi:MAG: phage holin family protein [Caldilineaceae bacterium]|nr:phage holin family protein [Caldilineaceae bacterium]